MTVNGVGATYQFTATVQDQSGHTMAGASVSWSSSDAAVVTISNTGLATAVAVGTATISATSGAASSSASLAVIRTLSSASDLLSFSFTGAQNAALSGDVSGLIEGHDVTILVPASIDATEMIASFTVSPAASVDIAGVQQVDGETRNDFTKVIRYTVIAEDQSTSTYTVYLGRLLEEGEDLGWQRNVGNFSLFSDPRDIKLLETLRVHFDSTWTRIADTLNVTFTDTITIHVHPTKASLDDFYRSKGWDMPDWAVGSALGSRFIVVLSANSPDKDFPLADFLDVALHEATHSIVATFGGPDTPVPSWLNEGLAGLGPELLAGCFPDCSHNWDYQRSVIASTGKPDLVNMFDDPFVGYAFCYTTVLFIVKKYGWAGLQTFLTDFNDFSVFGMADSDAFEAAWHVFLDELMGPVSSPGIPVDEARISAG